MKTILPEEITSSIKDNIERFGKAIDFRISMFRNSASGTFVDLNPVSDGYYNATTGEYDLTDYVWIKKITGIITDQTHNIFKVEYEDKNGNWILAHTAEITDSTVDLILSHPIFVKKLRIVQYKGLDETATLVPGTILLTSDTFFDITDYIGVQIALEQNTAGFSDNIKIPFTSLNLENVNGRWNKNTTFSIPYFYTRRVSGVYGFVDLGNDDVKTYKKNGTRVTVEIKFLGDDFADADWILISNFHVRKWNNNTMSGESGWIAKTKIDSPLIEGETVDNIVEKYIIRKDDGEILIHFHKPDGQGEIITVYNEKLGEIELLNPDSPAFEDGLADQSKILAHCYDGTYFYWAIRDPNGDHTVDRGYGVEIRKARPGGEVETLGIIRPHVPSQIYWDTPIPAGNPPGIYDFETLVYTNSTTNDIKGGADFNRYTQHVFQMAVDEGFLYIPVCNAFWFFGDNGGFKGTVGFTESCIYKLSKNGGWQSKFDPDFVGGSGIIDPTITQPDERDTVMLQKAYAQSYVLSFGFDQFKEIDGLSDRDLYNPIPAGAAWVSSFTGGASHVFCGVEVIDGGKLLVLVKKKALDDSSANPMTEYWEIDRNFDPFNRPYPFNTWNDIMMTHKGSSGDREWVVCTQTINDKLSYVHWEDQSDDALYFGVFKKEQNGDYAIDSGIDAVDIGQLILSISFFEDGIYSTGNNYLKSNEYQTNTDNGIKQLYRNLFQLQGYNISHFNNSIFNDFLSYPVPYIAIGAGEDPSNKIVRFAQDSLVDSVYTTIPYQLNLLTGELFIRSIFPSGQSFNVLASYDFTLSSLFYSALDSSRLSRNILGKLQEASQGTYFINEHGGLEKLKFLETQTIPMKNVIDEFGLTNSENPITNPEIEGNYSMNVTLPGTLERITGIQFTAQFTGKLKSFKLPINFNQQFGYSLDPNMTFDFHIANNNTTSVDLSRSGSGLKPVTPPTTANIKTLVTNQGHFPNPGYLTIQSGGFNRSEFKWYEYDLSSADFTVNKGQVYVLFIRQAQPVDAGNFWQWLGKKAMMEEASFDFAFENRAIRFDITAGADISTVLSTDWNVLSASQEWVLMSEIVIQKTEQELKSINVIDSLNPNISSGFTSEIGGVNSTFIVRSSDFATEYIRDTDYILTFTGGKFLLTFLTFSLDSSVICQWYESKTDLIKLYDSPGGDTEIIGESSDHGDHSLYLRTTIKGERRRPSSSSIELNKRFNMFPGLAKEVEADNAQVKQVGAVSAVDWNDIENRFNDPSPSASESENEFAVEFDDPFIIGTTSFLVKRGKGLATDDIDSGFKWISPTDDIPLFYRINISAGFSDNDYEVMLKQDQYLEWRVAIKSDFTDMTSDFVSGLPPSSMEDIKTSTHFYLKRMNGRFGKIIVDWIVYKTEEVSFFVNHDGVVVEDPSFIPDSPRNPSRTAYAAKRISVDLTPADLLGNPLFSAHTDGGDGDDPAYHADIKNYMAARITRATIKANGLTAIYDNYDPVDTKFLEVKVVGYPVNHITGLIADIKNPGFEHADAKHLEITNTLLQHQAIVDRLAQSLNNFFGTERLNYTLVTSYHPLLRPGAIPRVTSEREGLSDNLFITTDPRHSLSFTDNGFTTTFRKLLQI